MISVTLDGSACDDEASTTATRATTRTAEENRFMPAQVVVCVPGSMRWDEQYGKCLSAQFDKIGSL
jgi:hypothetical protein